MNKRFVVTDISLNVLLKNKRDNTEKYLHRSFIFLRFLLKQNTLRSQNIDTWPITFELYN